MRPQATTLLLAGIAVAAVGFGHRKKLLKAARKVCACGLHDGVLRSAWFASLALCLCLATPWTGSPANRAGASLLTVLQVLQVLDWRRRPALVPQVLHR